MSGGHEDRLMESGVEVHAASRPRPDISPLGPTYRALSLGIFAIVVVIAFEFMAVATALPVAARELAERMGGRLGVVSSKGFTAFILDLPLGLPAPSPSRGAPDEAPSGATA